jgi:uncharacterized protein (TIRG00374 family)
MNVGGVTRISLQFVLMKRRSLPTRDILAASFLQLYFSSVMLMILLPLGLVSIQADSLQPSNSTLGMAIGTGILTLLLVVASIMVFSTMVRRFMFKGLGRVFHYVTRRNLNSTLNDLNMTLTHGVYLIRQRPRLLVILFALAVGDWASTVTALWFCFTALGYSMATGHLLTGFTLGITARFISFIPGGLGVQEGSMAGIYALLGVPLGYHSGVCPFTGACNHPSCLKSSDSYGNETQVLSAWNKLNSLKAIFSWIVKGLTTRI